LSQLFSGKKAIVRKLIRSAILNRNLFHQAVLITNGSRKSTSSAKPGAKEIAAGR